jgi:hypothetical protein
MLPPFREIRRPVVVRSLYPAQRNVRVMGAIQVAPDEASALAIVKQSLEPLSTGWAGLLGRDDGSRHRR